MLLFFNPQATLTSDSSPPHGAIGPGHGRPGRVAGFLAAVASVEGCGIEKEVVWPLGGRSIYSRDPAGNSVELVTPGVRGTEAGW